LLSSPEEAVVLPFCYLTVRKWGRKTLSCEKEKALVKLKSVAMALIVPERGMTTI
jgi:hypothetical protein